MAQHARYACYNCSKGFQSSDELLSHLKKGPACVHQSNPGMDVPIQTTELSTRERQSGVPIAPKSPATNSSRSSAARDRRPSNGERNREPSSSEPPSKKKYAPDPNFIPFHTDPPYTLPAGVDTCPVPGCSAQGTRFYPYWRINEHMKMRHGWPRKHAQKYTDRRMRGNRRARHYLQKASTSPHPPERQSTPPSPTMTERGPSEHRNHVKQEREPEVIAISSSRSSSGLSSPPSNPITSSSRKPLDTNTANLRSSTSFVPIVNGGALHRDDDDADDDGEADGHRAGLDENFVPSSVIDEDVIARIKLHTRELEAATRSNNDDPKEAESRANMISHLKRLVNDGSICVNTIMPVTKCQSIAPVYKALVSRTAFQARYRMPAPVLVKTPKRQGKFRHFDPGATFPIGRPKASKSTPVSNSVRPATATDRNSNQPLVSSKSPSNVILTDAQPYPPKNGIKLKLNVG